RFGRKKVIIPALIIYGIGGLLSGLSVWLLGSKAFGLLLAGRIIQGIGAAGTAPVAMALCGDLFQGSQRSKILGLMEASNGFGKVISPILGSALGLIIWYAVFLFFPIIMVPVVLALAFLVKEKDKNTQKQSCQAYWQAVKQIFAKKSGLLLTSFLAGMSTLLILFGVLFFLSEYLEKTYHLQGIPKGLALAVPVLFLTITSFLTGLGLKKQTKPLKWLVCSGLGIIALAMALLGIFSHNTWLFFISISLAGVGAGLAMPCLNIIITSSCSAERRGMLTSLYGSVRFFGVAIGPPAFGLLWGMGRPAMFWSAAALGLAAALLSLFFIKTDQLASGSAAK
ncbi:MAG: MFS transporter, partial [Clostridia bacterium]|nr:MFS transporter [Clostridia bacterium]